MIDERIRRAKQAEIEALVDEHGTEGERLELIYSGMREAGVTVTQLVGAVENDESLGALPPNRGVLARLARRFERRRKLDLPKKDCATWRLDSSCTCLGDTLDEIDEAASKSEVLAAARKLHRARHRASGRCRCPA